MTRVADKAIRLLAEGRVQPNGTVQAFTVQGDTGRYHVFIGPDIAASRCPATTRCSHLEAAIQWTDAGYDEHVLMAACLNQRKARDKADELIGH